MRALPFPLGRVSARGLVALLLVALCLGGAAQVARGALVPAKAAIAQLLLEHAFARSQALHRPQKPWPWADMEPVARIRVPRLGVERIVLGSGSGQAMAFGPTLLPGGATPGAPGVTVIAAHRDTHFRFLRDLRKGDVVEVDGVDGPRHRYRVTGAEVVHWDGFAVQQNAPVNLLALATCYPFDAIGHGPLRYVLWAQPVE